ncbi:MAG: GNAT family N-acetyltransferase [Methanomassiliicoccus sp.]|nr:GNAT family N-acetyltransferase [Methanomassiliicoccus sp.]
MSMFARKGKDVTIRRMTAEDVEEVREAGQLAWSDLATQSVGRKFTYPKRSQKIIAAYLWKDPQGCLVAVEKGKIIGSAFCHVVGRVGWTGPLEVLPSYQDHGVGRRLLAGCEAHLLERGCSVIGLETLSNIPKNLHFYLTAGYRPEKTVVILERILRRNDVVTEGVSEIAPDAVGDISQYISPLSQRINPYLDYSMDAEVILRKELGKVYVLKEGESVQGCALLHTYHHGEESAYASIKTVLVDPSVPDHNQALDRLLAACEAGTLEAGKEKVMTRFAVSDTSLYMAMLSRTYLLKGANVRMIKKGEYNEVGNCNITSWAG